jgi:hypothetical protein
MDYAAGQPDNALAFTANLPQLPNAPIRNASLHHLHLLGVNLHT